MKLTTINFELLFVASLRALGRAFRAALLPSNCLSIQCCCHEHIIIVRDTELDSMHWKDAADAIADADIAEGASAEEDAEGAGAAVWQCN